MGSYCILCGRYVNWFDTLGNQNYPFRLYSLRKKLFSRKDVVLVTHLAHFGGAQELIAKGNGFHEAKAYRRGGRGQIRKFGVLNGKVYVDDLPHDQHGCQGLTPKQINFLMGIKPSVRRPISQGIRKAVLRAFENKCARCRKQTDLEMHHRRPVIHGGTNDFENLVLLCWNCHFHNSGAFTERIWPDLEACFLATEGASKGVAG